VELPLTGDQVVCLGRDQAAWSGPASMSLAFNLMVACPAPHDETNTGDGGTERHRRTGLGFQKGVVLAAIIARQQRGPTSFDHQLRYGILETDTGGCVETIPGTREARNASVVTNSFTRRPVIAILEVSG